MAKWTGKKVKVAFTKPEEPSFLKDFKRRAGYKEGTTVTDKVSGTSTQTLFLVHT